MAEPAAAVPLSPSAEQVKEARLKAGMSTEKAGALLYRTARNWQQWEAGERQMDAALWELFRSLAQPDNLIVLDSALQPSLYLDFESWAAAVRQIDEHWIEPALALKKLEDGVK